MEAFSTSNSNAFSANELVELVARNSNAARADLLGTGRAVLNGANTIFHFVSFSASQLEALVVLENRSFRALDDEGLDALSVLKSETFTALAHNTSTVFELESFFASNSFASLSLLIESEEFRFTTADSVALSFNKLLASRAANSVANVLLGSSIVLKSKTFTAGNLGADSTFKSFTFRARLNANTVLEGKSRFAGEDDALSEVSVVLLVNWAFNSDASTALKFETSLAFDGNAFAFLFNFTNSTSNLEAFTVLKGETRLATSDDTFAALDIKLGVFTAADTDSAVSSAVSNRARSNSRRTGGRSSLESWLNALAVL